MNSNHYAPYNYNNPTGVRSNVGGGGNATPRSDAVMSGKVSHKLAERRRRRELKALFEELRREVPSIRNHSKASKWDILNAAASHIERMEEKKSRLIHRKEAIIRAIKDNCK